MVMEVNRRLLYFHGIYKGEMGDGKGARFGLGKTDVRVGIYGVQT